ncbi:MAG TPA: YSC84-related protein [Nitrospirota bacterium]|nr:YSC84-related protein [Nitrospirota bacterium]
MNIFRKRGVAAALSLMTALLALAPAAHALTKAEINVSVGATMARFRRDIKGAPEYLKAAKGVLVMPHVTKAGFIIGGQYGQGSLLVDNKPVQYYSLVSGSLGYQIGAEQYDMVVIFMTDDALKKFRTSEGWEAGADADIALINVGASATVETLRSQNPIVGFVFDQKGLMAGLSLRGAKFTPIKPDEDRF